MKKNVIIIAFSLCGLCANAQSLLGDYLKDVGYEGQHNTIISDAVAPALTIIRQQYRLERGGEYFGKNKRPYYGETYTLGIKVSGGTIMQRGVVIPWENDADYHRVKQGDKYKPAIYWSLQRSLSDSIWKTVELELGTQYVSSVDRDSLLFRHADAMSDFGLPVDETTGKKKGYLLWAYSNTSVQDSAMHVSLRQVSHHIETSADSVYYSVSPKDAEKVIGGVFVVPVIERAGYIKLQMAGIASKNKKGKWVLYSLARYDNDTGKTKEPAKKEKGKRRKDSEREAKVEETVDDFEPTPIK